MAADRNRALWALGGNSESQEVVDELEDDENDDDEDDVGTVETGSMSVARTATGGSSSNALQNRRRELHTQAEQKRRDAIKRGYEELASHIPSLQANLGASTSEAGSNAARKASKSAILSKSVDLIRYLEKQRAKQRDELETLRKEVQTLTSIKRSYENIARAGSSRGPADRDRQSDASGSPASNLLSDEQKMAVFTGFSDELFRAFDATVSSNEFDALVSSVVLFVETNCTPQRLRTIAQHSLRAANVSQAESEPR